MLDEDIYAVRNQLLDLLIDVASGRTSARAERSDRGLIALFKTGVTL
jgi:altronate dehydratase